MCYVVIVSCTCHQVLSKETRLCSLVSTTGLCLDPSKVSTYSHNNVLCGYTNTLLVRTSTRTSLMLDSIMRVQNIVIDCNLIPPSMRMGDSSVDEIRDAYRKTVSVVNDLTFEESSTEINCEEYLIDMDEIDPSDSVTVISNKSNSRKSDQLRNRRDSKTLWNDTFTNSLKSLNIDDDNSTIQYTPSNTSIASRQSKRSKHSKTSKHSRIGSHRHT